MFAIKSTQTLTKFAISINLFTAMLDRKKVVTILFQCEGMLLEIQLSYFGLLAWLRMRDDLSNQECIISKLNYGYYTCALV